MIGTLRDIHRGSDGSPSELRRLESELQAVQIEGTTSQRSAAIRRLAELMDHDQRVARLKDGKFSSWQLPSAVFESPQG